MNQKKQISNLKFAWIHFLIVGFTVFLLDFLIILIINGINQLIKIKEIISQSFDSLEYLKVLAFLFFETIFYILPIWIGIKISVKYLKKKYLIEDKNQTLKYSILLAFIFLCVWFIANPFLYATVDFFLKNFIGDFLKLTLEPFPSLLLTSIRLFPDGLLILGPFIFLCIPLLSFCLFTKKHFSEIGSLDEKMLSKKSKTAIYILIFIVICLISLFLLILSIWFLSLFPCCS